MEADRVTEYLEKPVIQQYKSDVGFRTLVDSVNDHMYVIPKYQRKYRWNKEKVVGLVESLLRGLPIPPIYTCRNGDNQLEILDGQQRVMSLFFYYIGAFLDRRKASAVNFSSLLIKDNQTFKEALQEQFPLEELHITLSGEQGREINVDYASLPVAVKRKVDYTTITVIEIKIDQPDQRERVLRTIFANLNKGGELLSEQEQRNGIYNCTFYDMLREFNRDNAKWRSLWGREDAKERDMETLLRFCALRKYTSYLSGKNEFVIEGYQSNYVKMLDRFSEESMDFTEKENAEYKKSLEDFVNLFEVTMKFSQKVALLESLYVIFEKKGFCSKITQEMCDEILGSSIYTSNSRQGTVEMSRMNKRWNAVYEISARSDGANY